MAHSPQSAKPLTGRRTRLWAALLLATGIAAASGLEAFWSGGEPKTNSQADPEERLRRLRAEMVAEQIARRGVRNEGVLEVMRAVPRHLFVPPSAQAEAYADKPLPIGSGQTISQPYIVAFMTELLGAGREDVVLEIGTGSGYQAAVLARLARQVYTIEIIPQLAREAEARLMRMGYSNIEVRAGDGYLGWPEHAPFERILVTAAPPEIPEALVAQLKRGGRMVLPVGKTGRTQQLMVLEKSRTSDEIVGRNVIPVRFVPMVEGP
jgi:protein-L-isoaspartate(D-aspartate) O-methyltransferase